MSLPNPAQVTINELVVAITSVDVLFALSSDEVHRVPQGAPPGDRMARLASHLVSSASLYPLFPPAQGDPVLPSHLEGLRMPVRPDLLLLPGQLRHFAKDLSGCVAVNPGRLCKRAAAGTWSRITCWPLRVGDAPVKEEGDTEEEGTVEHGLGGRCRVEVVRI
jgi:DNA polymerase alpha subunit B